VSGVEGHPDGGEIRVDGPRKIQYALLLPAFNLAMSDSTFLHRVLLLIVVLSPLPLGGNRPWAWSLLSVAVGLVLILWILGVISGRVSTAVGGREQR